VLVKKKEKPEFHLWENNGPDVKKTSNKIANAVLKKAIGQK